MMDENPYLAPLLDRSPAEHTDLAGSAVRAMTAQERLGGWLVAAAIALTLCGDGLVITLKVMHSGMSASGSSFDRWFLTAALLYAVWQGQRWARWLTVALMGFALLILFPAVLQGGMSPLLFAVAVQIAAVFTILAFPPSVSAFLQVQASRRTQTHE